MATRSPSEIWRILLLFMFLSFLGVIKCQDGTTSTSDIGFGSTSTPSSVIRPGNNFPPVELYPFGEESGDLEVSRGDDSGFGVLFSFPFAGVTYDIVYININGIISLGTGYTVFNPSDFPLFSPPLIAPFWLDLDTRFNGSIFYRFENDTGATDLAINAYNNFSFPTFSSTGALLVTYHEVPVRDSSQRTETFQVYLTTDGSRSYVFYVYSDDIYPRGAVIGINFGDGINFELQASTTTRNSDSIAQGTNAELFERRGLYFYQLDNLPSFNSTSTPFVPGGSGSGSGTCNNGDVRGEQPILGSNFLSSEGDFVLNTSLLLTTCVGGSFGGVCHRGVNNAEADNACSFLGYNYGGEVAFNQSNSYTGPIYIQDVNCTGEETHLSQCGVNTDLTPDCISSSNIVRINCFTEIPIPCDDSGTLYPVRRANSSSFPLFPGSVVESFYTAQLAYCVNGTSYGICQSNFNDDAALVACRSFVEFTPGLNITRAETIYNGYTSNMAPLYLQDVSCTGTEDSYRDCNASLVTDPFCTDPSNAVGVRCYFEIELFTFGVEFGDLEVGRGDDSSFGVSFFFPFAGVYYDMVYINTNGILSLGTGYTVFNPSDFPFFSPPLIAPFWLDLDTRFNGSIFYRFENDTSATDFAINAYNNFSFPTFASTGALLVTYHEVPVRGSSQRTETFQVYLTTDGSRSYVFYVYSDDIYPRGAVVGINIGDGINFNLQASTRARNSDTIALETNSEFFERRGLYFYRLDNLPFFNNISTPVVPGGSGSGSGVCSTGDLRGEQIMPGSHFLSAEGNFIINTSVLLTACVEGSFGGVCRRGFDDAEADFACRFLGYNYGGEVAFNQSNSYTGPIYIQDVNCTGEEALPSQCGMNTFLTPDCFSSSSIVRINCFRERFDNCEFAGYPCQNNGTCIDRNGTYFCQCTETYDGQNCEIPVSTEREPSIIRDPKSGIFNVGSTITLSCIADGIPTPVITWLFDNQLTDFPSEQSIAINITPERRGTYACRAENSLGSVISSSAFITLNDIQQYSVGLALSSRRRRQTTLGQTLQEIVNSIIGQQIGSTRITIYSASFTQISTDGRSATVLYTLQRPDGVEFSSEVTSALSSTISSISTAVTVTNIDRFDACSEDISEGYRWPASSLLPDVQVQLPCQCNSTDRDVLPGVATRICAGSFVTGAAWQTPDSSSCVFDSFVEQICSASSEDVFNAISLGVRSAQSVNLSLSIVAEVLSAPVTQQTLDGASDAINALLMAQTNSTFASQIRNSGITFVNDILEQVENLGNAIGQISDDQVIKTNLLNIRYQKVSKNQLTSSDIYTVEPGTPVVTFNSEVAELFSGDVPLTLANIDYRSIGRGSRVLGTFSNTLFSISTGSVQVSRLSRTITILFPVTSELDNPMACVFWDPQLDSGFGDWSEEGCTVDKSDDGEARCRCNHLSTFGVIYGDSLPSVTPSAEIAEVFEVSLIIYVCLILSILILFIIVIMYLIGRNLRKQAQIIFINTSLIGLYITYMISTAARQLNNHDTSNGQNVCGLFAAILEYFQLVFFFWTTSEAIILVLMANNSKLPKYYFIVSAIVCYLLPLVMVAISLGGYQYFLRDSFCISLNWPFYFGFVAAFAVFAVLNVILYLLTAHTLWSDQSMKYEVKVYLTHYVIVATILLVAIVVAWIFGLLGTINQFNKNSYVAAQYVFSLVALLHSILTVLLHIIRSREAREILTCNRAVKRFYYTAGTKPASEVTELAQSYTTYIAPSTSRAREESAALLDPSKGMPVENIYTSSPGGAATSEDMGADDNPVKENMNMDEDDSENNIITSL